MASEYASKVLGAALLQGWTMSAEECQREYCPGCPLMVSKDKKESFCARCDGGEKVGIPRQGLVEPLATSLSSKLHDQTRVSSPTSSRAGEDAEPDEDLYVPPSGRETVPNTPPTPHSHLNSPPLLPPTLPVLDPQIQNARRAQTDRASALLAQKMLQGWTLLGEECSSESCHAVPLMRRPPVKLPKKDGEDNAPVTKLVDPRRHCVLCQRDYVREGDIKAYEYFTAAVSGSTPSTSTAALTTKRQDGDAEDAILHSAAAKKRRFSTQPATSQLNTSKVMGFGSGNASRDVKGKSRVVSTEQTSSLVPAPGKVATGSATSLHTSKLASVKEKESSPESHLDRDIMVPASTAIVALEEAVATLSNHLTSLCRKGSTVDPIQIAEAAEALSTTCKSLEDVKALYN